MGYIEIYIYMIDLYIYSIYIYIWLASQNDKEGTSGNHVAKFAAFWPGMPWSASLKNNKGT